MLNEAAPLSNPTSNLPNIVLILCDDLGFSDIGCYGSEIRTPNLDQLASNGIRFTQMYNSARCCPSRAALLTGVHPHQTGVGHMSEDLGHPSYRGYLSPTVATVAEALRGNGYFTMMSGKWHLGGDYSINGPIGSPNHPMPTQRGFDRFWGMLAGAGSYFNPSMIIDQEKPVKIETQDFYLTDAISDKAVEMIEEANGLDRPFFLYTAYTAPHWPLHALEEDIARYEGIYRGGWDQLRTSRHEQLKGLGLLDSKWPISTRDVDSVPWTDAPNKEWEDVRMAVYAAQIDSMDRGIGRILAKLKQIDQDENTLTIFLSDNGGCAEFMREDPRTTESLRLDLVTSDGSQIRVGNEPSIRPGPADTYMSYDLQWASASNSPFRLFKRWVHEGGISTPFIMHWPAQIKQREVVHSAAHIIDITATCVEAAGAKWPTEVSGNPITPLEGESLMPIVGGSKWQRNQPICWEHEGNRAVRLGGWKLVSEFPGNWELYDMYEDRTELYDLAANNPEKVAEMVEIYRQWAERCGVLPWPIKGLTKDKTRGRHDHDSSP
ncbi:MAG: arylsulfatase [SAR202 cluster bacterium]|nr:arylsulfatase [SAR202 cluster bacterium]